MPKKNVVAEEKQNAQNAEPAVPRLAFSLRETAGILGVSYISVVRLAKRGLLRPSNALRCRRVSKVEIERFLAETQANRA